jgi:hypothetical protein
MQRARIRMPLVDKKRVIGVGIVVCLLCAGAAYVAPNTLSMGFRAQRAEVPRNVEDIATSERAYDALNDHFLAAGNRAEAEADLRAGRAANGKARPRPWTGGGGWDEFAWKPDGEIRGAYWVEVPPTQDSFVVFGVIDLDGDGKIAESRWDPATGTARLVTLDTVY